MCGQKKKLINEIYKSIIYIKKSSVWPNHTNVPQFWNVQSFLLLQKSILINWDISKNIRLIIQVLKEVSRNTLTPLQYQNQKINVIKNEIKMVSFFENCYYLSTLIQLIFGIFCTRNNITDQIFDNITLFFVQHSISMIMWSHFDNVRLFLLQKPMLIT